MKPLIGITPMYDYNERISFMKKGYQEGIIQAGGVPFVIPFTSDEKILYQLLNILDGLVLSGGCDIDPKYFNQDTYRETSEISPERDIQELYLSRRAIEENIPILGICRGCQVLNISAGGDIYQDIYKETGTNLKHSQQAPKWYPSHSINIKSASIHEKIYNSNQIRVNSFHHQGIKNLGDGFLTAAAAPDGIIEAIEHKNKSFCVGVQYHPELMWERDDKFLGLFFALVNTAKK